MGVLYAIRVCNSATVMLHILFFLVFCSYHYYFHRHSTASPTNYRHPHHCRIVHLQNLPLWKVFNFHFILCCWSKINLIWFDRKRNISNSNDDGDTIDVREINVNVTRSFVECTSKRMDACVLLFLWKLEMFQRVPIIICIRIYFLMFWCFDDVMKRRGKEKMIMHFDKSFLYSGKHELRIRWLFGWMLFSLYTLIRVFLETCTQNSSQSLCFSRNIERFSVFAVIFSGSHNAVIFVFLEYHTILCTFYCCSPPDVTEIS